MKEEIKLKYSKDGNVIEAFSENIEVGEPYIVMASSVWQQFAIYNKEDLKVVNNEIIVINDADKKLNAIKIKAKAGEIITSKYSIIKQNNILMSQNEDDIKTMNDYISNIRAISNKAEINGTALDDINWGI